MCRQLINEYRSELDRIIKVGGTLNEGTVHDAFQSLLKAWGRSNDLTYLSEHKMTGSGANIFVDGALVYDIRVPFGYWEAKDSKDNLEEEITKKEAKGYPKSNIIYGDTQLTGIPAGAWDYRLGNRSATDGVLDQHKEKNPRDPTIAEKFNTYRFADYKQSMIELLGKVVRVSVETNAITDAMAGLDRSDWEG